MSFFAPNDKIITPKLWCHITKKGEAFPLKQWRRFFEFSLSTPLHVENYLLVICCR